MMKTMTAITCVHQPVHVFILTSIMCILSYSHNIQYAIFNVWVEAMKLYCND